MDECDVPTSVDDDVPNSFTEKSFFVGSHFILKNLISEAASLGKDVHFSFLAALISESGYEDLRAHV